MGRKRHSFLQLEKFVAWAFAFSLTGVSCTIASNLDQVQCTTPSDCGENLACEEGICVDPISAPPHDLRLIDPSCRLGEEIPEGSVAVYSPITQEPIERASVSLCSRFDPQCESPLFTGRSGPDGLVTLSVAPGTSGYFEVTLDGYTPQIVMAKAPIFDEKDLNRPPIGAPFQPGVFSIPLLRPEETSILSSMLGIGLDPERGVVAASVTQCLYEGKTYSVEISNEDADSVPFCVLNGLPSSSVRTVTDGACGFMNVKPGLVTVTLTDERGRMVAADPTYVRAGWFSTATITPPLAEEPQAEE